ncbi:MAG: creatininase family protein [Anaerolineae bacterium]|nr:creatininase family protein [Anaerolineae bacterium]
MQWEHLTATDFAQAVRDTGVCLIAMGVVERHSEHLPLGTDFMNGHKLCCLAAEREPAVVFPPFYFGQIYEARCFPGTVTLKPTLLIELIQAVFDEIGRNGFKKIIVHNAHGGNGNLLGFLAQCTLWEQKPYSIYLPTQHVLPGKEAERKAILETEYHGHACECETSVSLANHPELVKMDRVPAEPALPLGRLNETPTRSGIWWYANHPDHYAGDARAASREKGLKLRDLEVEYLAHYIAQVKADRAVPALEREFFERADNLDAK